jgi:hypothetical protein
VLNPPTPRGSWAYPVDDHSIGYGPGCWPYHRACGPQQKRQRVLHLLLAAGTERRSASAPVVTADQRWQAEGDRP